MVRKDGLEHLVNGFAYKRKVTVGYNAGNDTFSVIIGDETFEDIYFDELFEFIDAHVEKDCADSEYVNKVGNWIQSDKYKEMFAYYEE